MNSITTAKLKLPFDFIQNLYHDFSEREANKILSGMLENRYTTMRVNTLKCTTNEIEQMLNKLEIKYEKVEFCDFAFIIKNKNEKELSSYDFYKKGLIYIQSLSSMIPAIVLDSKPGNKVLDLAAAPGSKTTQIAANMNNEGYILANEIDKIRCEKLRYNINLQGVKIAEVLNKDGRNLEIIEQFDKVLLDTPCSGEGRFIVDNYKSYANWSEKMIKELVPLQKELLKSACKALKINGTLVYSTCTLNLKENEEIIDFAIKELKMQVLDINMHLKEMTKASNKGFPKDVQKAIKILPSKRMEGFFICKLRKTEKC